MVCILGNLIWSYYSTLCCSIPVHSVHCVSSGAKYWNDNRLVLGFYHLVSHKGLPHVLPFVSNEWITVVWFDSVKRTIMQPVLGDGMMNMVPNIVFPCHSFLVCFDKQANHMSRLTPPATPNVTKCTVLVSWPMHAFAHEQESKLKPILNHQKSHTINAEEQAEHTQKWLLPVTETNFIPIFIQTNKKSIFYKHMFTINQGNLQSVNVLATT